MMIKILLGLSVAQIIFNFLQYLSIRRLFLELEQDRPEDEASFQNEMVQIESNLNTRLREIQTTQFSPHVSRVPIRLVKPQGDD